VVSKQEILKQTLEQVETSDFTDEEKLEIKQKLNIASYDQLIQFSNGEPVKDWDKLIDNSEPNGPDSKESPGEPPAAASAAPAATPSQEPTQTPQDKLDAIAAEEKQKADAAAEKRAAVEKENIEKEKAAAMARASAAETQRLDAELMEAEIEKDADKFTAILESNEDARDFMAMYMVTDQISDPSNLDDYAKSSFLKNYYSWVAAGKPKPQMPKLAPEKIVIPVTFYRILDRKNDMMFWVDNFGKHHGIKVTPIFATQKHPLTHKVVNSAVLTGKEKVEYVMKFSAKEFQDLQDKGEELNPPNVKMRHYIMQNRTPYVVKSADFAMPSFDKLFKKATTPGYVV